jgi:hypothetical protein
VLDANENTGADEIVFDASVSGAVELTSGPLELRDSVTVAGPGSESLSIDAGGISEIFLVTDSSPVSAGNPVSSRAGRKALLLCLNLTQNSVKCEHG